MSPDPQEMPPAPRSEIPRSEVPRSEVPRSEVPPRDPAPDATEWAPPPEPAAQPWRIKPVIPVTKLLGAVAVIVLAVAFGRRDPVQWFLAIAAAIGLTAWAARDLIAPVRLAADREGVTVVVGFAGHRRLAWAQIERVRMDRRERLGVRSNLLELDAGDTLYLFSVHDLGADPEDVLGSVLALRSASRSGTPPAE
jgi:Bacterial PH domain